MEEIKVGEWVRTKEGEIIKVREDYVIFADDDGLFIDTYMLPYEQKIVEHSENIIDLIEEGDYVNGFRILQKTKIKDGNMQVCILKDNNTSNWITINNYTLKSIVTKEQFSSVEYRLEE